METFDLLLFAEVARRGSFAAVAKSRNVDPSSVSRTIAALEATLGVRLFQRTTRRMSLTEDGESLLARAVPLAEDLSSIVQDARDGRSDPSGTLRITASVSFGQCWILPRLPAFQARYPRVMVECVFTDANLDIVAERIDLAVRLGPSIEGGVVVTKLMDTRYRVVASPGYLSGADPIRTPSDLQHHRCVLFNLPSWRDSWQFRQGQGDVVAVPIQGCISLSPASALRDAAVAGMGPALLADWLIADDLAAGRLTDLFPDHAASASNFDTAAWLVFPSRHHMPAKTRAMINFLKDLA